MLLELDGKFYLWESLGIKRLFLKVDDYDYDCSCDDNDDADDDNDASADDDNPDDNKGRDDNDGSVDLILTYLTVKLWLVK